jgi:hypothetical protein
MGAKMRRCRVLRKDVSRRITLSYGFSLFGMAVVEEIYFSLIYGEN